jgi:hypothetical protein
VYDLRRCIKQGKTVGSLGEISDTNVEEIEAAKAALEQHLISKLKGRASKTPRLAGLSGSNSFVSNTSTDPNLYEERYLNDSLLSDYLAQAAIVFSKYNRNNPPTPLTFAYWQKVHDAFERAAKSFTERQAAIAKQATSVKLEPTNTTTVAGQSKFVVNSLYNYKFGGMGWVWLAPLGEALVAALPKVIMWVGATIALDKVVKVFHGSAIAENESLSQYFGLIKSFVKNGEVSDQAIKLTSEINEVYKGNGGSTGGGSTGGGFFSNISTTFKVLGWTALVGGASYVGYRIYQSKK